MGDIFDSLAAQKDAQQQPALPPATAGKPVAFSQSIAGDDHSQGGGDIFDQIEAGKDVSLPKAAGDSSSPGHLDPHDTGVTQSLARNAVGLLRLPSHVIHAFSQPAQDSIEKSIAQALLPKDADPAKPIGGQAQLGIQTMLAFKRLIVDPMRAQHEQARAYEHMYDKMTPEERAKAEQTMSASNAQHMANMHHIASIVPILGPAAGDMVDRMANGDVSGGLTDLLFNIVTAGGMKKLAGKAAGAGPAEKAIAGEKVPVLASQEGNTLAANLEKTAQATGSGGGRISRFVDEQQTALKSAAGNVADSAAKEGIERMNKTPQAAERIIKPTVPTDDNIMELLKQSIEQANDKGAASTPAVVRNVVARSSNFQEAADTLRTAAAPKIKLVDDLTNGRLSEIWDERDALLKQAKQPGQTFNQWSQTQKDLAALGAEEQGLFSLRNATTGRFQKVITNAQRDSAMQAGKVWQQANDMEQIHAAMESGGNVGKKLASLDSDVIRRAVGDNQGHIQSIKDIARYMQSGAQAAQVNKILQLVKFVSQKGSLGTSNAASQGISMVLTNRAAANALATGIKTGAAAPIIAASIDKVLEREQKAE